MSEYELFFPVEGSKYGEGVLLNKHGDGYSLLQGQASKDGGTIYFTKNNSSGGVAFTCEGGPFENEDACNQAGMALINAQ